jgi:hypothetical protein
MEFVADTAGDRFAVFERCREIRAEPVIGARRAGVPARPDDRMAAPEEKTEPGVARRLRIVDRDRVVGRHIVDQAQDPLGAAVGHVIDQDAAAASRLGRPQNEEIGRVFNMARRVARRLVEIADAGVLRRPRVEDATRDAAHPHIPARLAKRLSLGKGLDGADRDPGNRHGAAHSIAPELHHIGAAFAMRPR